MNTSKFDIHKKNRKSITCTCGKRCERDQASKYYHYYDDNALLVLKHFHCKECYDRITCDGRLGNPKNNIRKG